MIADTTDVTKYPPLRNAYVDAMSRFAAVCSNAVITISENSRRGDWQICENSQSKIALAPPGNGFGAGDGRRDARAGAEHVPLTGTVYSIFWVRSSRQKTATFDSSVRALKTHPELEHHLVLAGAQGWGVGALEKEVQKSEATGFHLVGFVQDARPCRVVFARGCVCLPVAL